MEIWDLYTENRVLTGKKHIRGNELPDDYYHLVVHVWIKNKEGKFLISQRAKTRPTFPLMWECVGGSVLQGENSLQGALREVKEEVGIDLNPNSGKMIFSKLRGIIDGKKFNDIMDVWLFQYDGEVNLEQATTDEVSQVKWLNREQIQELFNEGKLVNTLKYFFDRICD
ncbi:MAG: NUDIX hydrolase [Eubacterium sp.]